MPTVNREWLTSTAQYIMREMEMCVLSPRHRADALVSSLRYCLEASSSIVFDDAPAADNLPSTIIPPVFANEIGGALFSRPVLIAVIGVAKLVPAQLTEKGGTGQPVGERPKVWRVLGNGLPLGVSSRYIELDQVRGWCKFPDAPRERIREPQRESPYYSGSFLNAARQWLEPLRGPNPVPDIEPEPPEPFFDPPSLTWGSAPPQVTDPVPAVAGSPQVPERIGYNVSFASSALRTPDYRNIEERVAADMANRICTEFYNQTTTGTNDQQAGSTPQSELRSNSGVAGAIQGTPQLR